MAGARLGLVEVALDALEKLCVEVERACRLRVERYRAKVELLRLLLVLQDLQHTQQCVVESPTPSRLTAFMINACVRRASEAAGTGKRPGGLGGETPSPDGVESIQRRTQTPYLLDEARVRKDHRYIRRLYLQAMHRNSYRHMCQHNGPNTHTTPAAPARECAVCPAGRGAHAMSAWRGCAAPAQTCRRSPKHVGGRPPPLKATAPLDTHSTHARTHAR